MYYAVCPLRINSVLHREVKHSVDIRVIVIDACSGPVISSYGTHTINTGACNLVCEIARRRHRDLPGSVLQGGGESPDTDVFLKSTIWTSGGESRREEDIRQTNTVLDSGERVERGGTEE
ncbi:hypothetical protein ElyMa_006863600 [Elysia marginata]|uniref:Uncharacterized protein n=1 Tax=Elysia marginata TaxID=1093978 RepID=A0AAV4JC51_9GAST|nr:hypothetical protein ElyMa_006863600 [Elysia marginata]